ncbi:MAG: DASS family sodium-coupled anion symporter [candidate division KSB1 bacterium]|nr:DASS family sodium-coupled anion symporter [candidate division KSB1 bacterium]
MRSIAHIYQSHPDDGTERRIGAYLIKTSFQGTMITGAMFLTGMAANPLAVNLAGDLGVDISWSLWALAAVLPGFLSLLCVPWILYKLYPPEIKETPEAAQLADKELSRMGPMSRQEYVMLFTFLLLLFLWVFGHVFSMHSATAAFVGLVILLVSGVLSWDDVLNEKGAWNTLVWFSALVMMASFLNILGLIPWFGETVGLLLTGLPWMTAFLFLSLIYFYSHYFFASSTAHVSSMYLPFLTVALSVQTPPIVAALVLAFFSNLYGSLTHYSMGPAPVMFGAGFVKMGDWWKIGGALSLVNILIWLVAGGVWWKIIGLW